MSTPISAADIDWEDVPWEDVPMPFDLELLEELLFVRPDQPPYSAQVMSLWRQANGDGFYAFMRQCYLSIEIDINFLLASGAPAVPAETGDEASPMTSDTPSATVGLALSPARPRPIQGETTAEPASEINFPLPSPDIVAARPPRRTRQEARELSLASRTTIVAGKPPRKRQADVEPAMEVNEQSSGAVKSAKRRLNKTRNSREKNADAK